MEVKQQYFSIKETATILGLAESTISNKIYNSKEINAVKIGGVTRISKEEIERLIVPMNK